MIIIRSALLTALICPALYSSAPAPQQKNPFELASYGSWLEKFTYTSYHGKLEPRSEVHQTSRYYAAVLAQNDRRDTIALEHLKATQEQNLIAAQQVQATQAHTAAIQQQNELMAQLLARLCAVQPQVPASAPTPALHADSLVPMRPAKPKSASRVRFAPAQIAQFKQSDNKSAAK